jgi:hypothetical protein
MSEELSWDHPQRRAERAERVRERDPRLRGDDAERRPRHWDEVVQRIAEDELARGVAETQALSVRRRPDDEPRGEV